MCLTMDIDDHTYSNMSPPPKPQWRDNHAGGVRRGRILVITVSVLLFLSLLTNAVLTYLYWKIKLEPCSPRLQMKKCTRGQQIEVQDGDRFYVFSQDQMSWNSSRKLCKELGGDLAIVNSKEEHEFLTRMVATVGNSSLHWIGLTDAKTEGVWLWVDQTPLMKNLSLWAYPPDDWKAHDPMGEDCAVYYKKGWADVSCSTQRKSICEIPCTPESH